MPNSSKLINVAWWTVVAMIVCAVVVLGGELYNDWNPVVQAQKQSLELLKASTPELERLNSQSERLAEQKRSLEHLNATRAPESAK
jgi:hypothetical protein